MNSASYVDEQIKVIKAKGIPRSDQAWELALLTVGWPYIFGDRGELCTPPKRQAVYNKHGGETLISKCQVLKGSADSCSGCKWFPNGKRVRSYDCRGFTYWVILQIYGWKLQGSGCTAQWNNKANWKAQGNVADGIPQGVLVCLFYPKKDKPKTIEHTGLYFNGETVECSSCVQHKTKLDKKWTLWGVPACVDDDYPDPVPPEPVKPTLRRGSRGPYVVECQTDLIRLGYDVGKTGADGIFGKNTENGVKTFQKQHVDAQGNKLIADGIVGEKTWFALDQATSELGG